MQYITKPIHSFSQLTSDLRKRLDEENIPWVDLSSIIEGRGGYISVLERTVLGNVSDSDCDAFYGWTNINGYKIPYSYGYPEKLEFINRNGGKKPQPMSIDEIIELYKEIRERNGNEHFL